MSWCDRVLLCVHFLNYGCIRNQDGREGEGGGNHDSVFSCLLDA